MTRPINVLLITADQWRGSCLSVLGHPTVRTPNLDTLAADGVLFRNHFAQCVPCGPSRASIFTGMYLMNHRSVRNGVPLDARFTNLALEARKGRYDPVLFGYTDTSVDPRRYDPNDPALTTYSSPLPGFREILGEKDGTGAWLHHLSGQGIDIPRRAFDIYKPLATGTPGRGPTFAPARYRAKDSDTAFMTDRVIDHLSAEDGAKPWFLHLSLLRPHPPFIAPHPYNALYHPDDVPDFRRADSPEAEGRQHPYAAFMIRHHLQKERLNPERHPATEPAMRQLRCTYYGLMSEVDHHLGRLIAHLKESGRYDDTLIVFASDHGEMLWDHWILGKQTYYDQAYHVPLIVRAPGRKWDKGRGRIVAAFSENIAIMPTILDVLGLEVPLQCDGAPLTPFLAGRRPRGWPREVHWEFDFRDIVEGHAEKELGIPFDHCNLAVLRDDRYKYIHFAALPPLLFDLRDDPDELRDLARDPAHAPTVMAYAQRMLSWRLAHADRTLTGIRLIDQGPYYCPPGRRRRVRTY